MFIMSSWLNLFTCSCVHISHLRCIHYITDANRVSSYMFVRRSARVVAMLFFFCQEREWTIRLFCIAFCNTWYELACRVISCVYISVFHSGTSREATPSQGVCLLVFARSGTSILSTYRQKYRMSYLFNLLLFLRLYASGPLLLRFLTKVDVASRGAQRQ